VTLIGRLGSTVALGIAAHVLASGGRAEAAGGAFAVDDAEIGAPGSCKVESWLSFASNHDFLGVVQPACVANIGRPVELSGAFARVRQGGEWGSDAVLKAKTNLIPVEPGKIGLGLFGVLVYDLTAGEAADVLLVAPATWQISEQFKINVNAGWLWDRVPDIHRFAWGAGFEWNFVKPLTLIAEVFGFAGRLPAAVEGEPPPSRSETQPRFQAGLRITPHEKIDIDLIYGRNILGENANWFTIGLNVRN
jgi:hypothetical protein